MMKSLLFAVLIALLPASCDKIPSYTIPFTDLSQHMPVACPPSDTTIVIATGGQSNAGNHLTARTQTAPQDHVYAFYDGRCYLAQDPMPGASGTRGSLWPTFGRKLAHMTGHPVLLISAARGGATYADWLNPQTGYMRDLLRQVHSAAQQGYSIGWIVWHQGETNAKTPESAPQAEKELSRLSAILLEEMPQARMYLFRVSRCSDKINIDGIPAMRDVQTRVAERNPRILSGMDTDILGPDYRIDRCHFNSFARDIITERAAKDLARVIQTTERAGK